MIRQQEISGEGVESLSQEGKRGLCLSERVATVFSIGVLGVLFSACSGSQTKPKDAASPEGSKTTAMEEAHEDRTPLSPVSAPSGLVVRMRIKNPGALVDGVLEATPLPLSWENLAGMVDSAKPYMDAFDAGGAIEMAVVMNVRHPSEPYHFLSVGAKGVAPVLSFLDAESIQVQEAPGGVFLFRWEDGPCAVGRAIEGSPARVVCSENDNSLLQLLPYALRGLPGHVLSDADAHFEIDLRPVRSTYGKKLRQLRLLASILARQMHVGNAKFDSALTDLANGAVEEASALLEDTDLLTVKLFQKAGAMRLVLGTQFSGESSTTVQSVRALAKLQGPAPELFDGLASTATAASYGRELPFERASPWFDVLADLLSGRAEFEGAGEMFSTRVSRLVKSIGPQGAKYVMAKGPLVESLKDGEKTLNPAWTLFGSERKKAEVVQILDDLAWLLSSKDLPKLMPDLKSVPLFHRSSKRLSGAPGASVFEWSLPEEMRELASELGEELPSELGDFSIERAILPFSKGYMAVHQAGGATWVSWGEQPRDLAESFRTVNSKDGEKLGDLGDLAGVRTEAAVSAGYTKLDGLASSLAWMAPSDILGGWSGLLRATPHRGSVPLVHFFKIEVQDRTELKWELRVPKEFTQDLSTLVVMIAAELGASLPGSSD